MMSTILAKPAGAYRVVHTADWHLGKCLGEKTRDEEHAAFLDFLCGAIKEHEVDALVIAGDVFDTANPPQRAVSQYYEFLARLCAECGCCVVVAAGNHDSPGHLDAPRDVLKSLRTYVMGACPVEADSLLIPLPSASAPQLVVAAVPFLRDRDLRTAFPGMTGEAIMKALTEGIERRYRELADAAEVWHARGVPIMAMGHLTAIGATASDSERDVHVGGLGAVSARTFPERFCYVGLGHFHRPQAVGGCEHVRYSGSPLPLSFSESNDRKSLCVLDFGEGRLLAQQQLAIPTHRYLLRLKTTRAELAGALRLLEPPAAAAPAWLEICVEGESTGDGLLSLVDQAMAGRTDLEVLQIVRGLGPGDCARLTDDGEEAEQIEAILGDPLALFARRLAAETELAEEERAALETAFAELLELHADQQRERDGGDWA